MSFPLHLRAPGWAERLKIRPPDPDIELGGAQDVHADEIEIARGDAEAGPERAAILPVEGSSGAGPRR